MQAETIIHHYNRLNGNSITRERLKQFHARVQSALDSNSHGSFVKDLRGILTRVTGVLKQNFDVIDRLEIVPIDTTKDTGKVLRVASGYEEKKQQSTVDSQRSTVDSRQSTIIAEAISLSKIHTDTKRFQNRMDAFSEASANSVAENYDPNKFDPIVIWKDPANNKLYVLSGHSRYEGMKRRGAKDIAARYFKGSEEQAIKFAKVEANRAANQESLIEDLAAYKLMRDGDESKGIKKLTKTELAKIFKGKVQKLDAYSFLSSGGLFVNALNQGTTSNYPYLERNAQWVGQLRNQHPVITNAGEDNIFHYFYSDKTGRNLKQSKEEFFKLAVRKINQLGKGEGVLFPECSSDGCAKVNDKETDPIKGESYKRLREVSEQLNAITEKLNSKNPNIRVTTDQEKKYLRDTAQRLQSEKEKIQRDLDIMDKSQSSLFGIDSIYGLEEFAPHGEGLSGLGFTKDGQAKIYDMITGKVLETMKKDGLFWRNKWDSGKVPEARNYPTERGYRGANWVMLTLMANANFGYSSPFFMTFNAIKKEGGTLRKKSSGWPVVYYNRVYWLNGKKITEEQFKALPKEVQDDDVDIRPFLQYYTVFNGQDIEGIELPETKYMQRIKSRTEFERLETAEEIVNNMPNRPDIDHGNRTAHYIPERDKIDMPDKRAFDNAQDYYSVLFHELIHSTAHKSRINRFIGGDQDSKEYMFEELVAELGASYLCAQAGILYHTLNDSANYVKHYSTMLEKILTDDNKFFLRAAAAAQKAADYVLDSVAEKVLAGPQYDAFNIAPKKKTKGPLNELQRAQLEDAIKAGRTPKVNLKAKMNATKKPAPLFDEPVNDPKQASLFGMKNEKAPSTQSGVNYSYTVVELGPYKKDFHRMFSDTIVQVHGMPGHGKTVYLLKKAQYRAAHTNDNVLYVAREEYGRSVFDMKLKEHNIGHKNLRFRKSLEAEDLKWATVIFLDSVTALKLNHEDVETLASDYPNRNWFVVLQSTKGGDFRGSQEWEHLVDIAGEVRNRKLILSKNRLDPNNSTKMEKLLTDDAIQEAKKKKVIREAVKDAQPKAIEEPKQIAA